jgi:hypothetical protein
MNQDNMITMAYGYSKKNPELDKQNPLATREMYAVKSNRSLLKSLRRGIASLLATIS